jgi:glycosyltransferase involved in cell wall biosynthesis
MRAHPHIDPSKITVTHLGVDALFFDATPAAVAGKPFFFFVGMRVGMKNFLRLLEAFAASGLAPEFDLRVVSRGGDFTPAERAVIERCGLTSSVKWMPPVADAELANLYAASVALLYPSEYEGFGLPVLEAMAAGTLVGTSSTSSLPEVGGDAAFYFDPLDVSSIAETIRTVAALSEGERVERSRRGVDWARTFTWSRCERQTMDVFDRLLSAS